MTEQRLSLAFFDRPTVRVARDLVGCDVVHVDPDDGTVRRARIVETEAYVGVRDKACHASRGLTPRTRAMFGPPGHAYLYLIYGMYWCFNVVTEAAGRACAVLVRAAVPVENCDSHLSGPGAFCRAMHLDGRRYAEPLDGDVLWLEGRSGRRPRIVSGPRVNVDYAGAWAARPWRFAQDQQPAVSRPRPFRLQRTRKAAP